MTAPGTQRHPRPRRRLGIALGLVALAVLLATFVARVAVPEAVMLVHGLRALGGAGVVPGEDPARGEDAPPGALPGEGTELSREGPTVPDDARAAVVDEVIDGDTLRVRISEPGGEGPPTRAVRVRLLNIDAPELHRPRRGQDCGAAAAATRVERLAPPGSRVHLVADEEDRDAHGRLLRGVWNERGTFVNAEVVRAGWAEVVLVEPNDRFHDELLELAAVAREENRGAWAVCGDS